MFTTPMVVCLPGMGASDDGVVLITGKTNHECYVAGVGVGTTGRYNNYWGEFGIWVFGIRHLGF